MGDELVNEIRSKQGKSTIDLCYYFVKNYKNISGKKQLGKSSFYRKRNSDDSELNINQTILEQFNLLRVCDNKRYPAHFYHMGQKYVIKIYKDEKHPHDVQKPKIIDFGKLNKKNLIKN